MANEASLTGRARPFPVEYQEQSDVTIEPARGYTGFAVVMPEGINAQYKMEFRVVLFVRQALGPVTFRPKGRGMMIIDVAEDFQFDPQSLNEIVAETWRKGGGRPTEPGQVKGNP
jgi:hypothetical protein